MNAVEVRRDSLSPIGIDVGALIDKAMSGSEAVAVIERLQVLRKEMNAERAKAAFDEAMASFQAKCPPVMKTKGVPDKSGRLAYAYAPIEVIEAVIRPHCQSHGFSHTFDTDTRSEPGWVIAKCIVTHASGHSRESVAKFPLTTRTGIMSDTQQYAATLTFANRRALMNAFGIVVCGEDLDGQVEKQKPRGPSKMEPDRGEARKLAGELWALLAPVRGPEKNWDAANQWLWREDILDAAADEAMPNLAPDRIRTVIAMAKEVLK